MALASFVLPPSHIRSSLRDRPPIRSRKVEIRHPYRRGWRRFYDGVFPLVCYVDRLVFIEN